MTATLSQGSGFKVSIEALYPEAKVIAKARSLGCEVTGHIPADAVDEVASLLESYERLKAQLQA